MNIIDYFKDYKKNSKFPFGFSSNDSCTIDDFYKNNISQIYSNPQNINNLIAWHNMLIEYIQDDNNIFWVRQYENGGKDSNDNRRASLVEFMDGFKILYVSNFDAQEILNMALIGVEPDLKQFKKLMNSHDYSFHYSTGCAENNTCSFPNCLNAKNYGVLTQANFYLAHIRSVNENSYCLNGISYNIKRKPKSNEKFHDKIFPKGEVSDYITGNTTNIKDRVYKRDYVLTNDEKNIIKAHFIRFIDPLNYFPIPGEKNHIYEYNNGSKQYKKIGEFPLLISYMYEKMKHIFTSIDFDEFDKITCFDKNNLQPNLPNTIVNVAVRAPKNYGFSHSHAKITNGSAKTKPQTSSNTNKKSNKRKTIFELTKKYINNNDINSFIDLDAVFPKIASLTKDIKDDKRFFKEIITLKNGDKIRITNQIGDKNNFPKNRNYSKLISKFSGLNINL